MREGWLARINDAVNLRMLRTGEAFDALPRTVQVTVIVAFLVAIVVAMRFLRITPIRRLHLDPR